MKPLETLFSSIDGSVLSVSFVLFLVLVCALIVYIAVTRGIKLGPIQISPPLKRKKTFNDYPGKHILYTWQDEKDKNIALRIKGNLIQLFGTIISAAHPGCFVAIREQWPTINEDKLVVVDVSDSNIPSVLLGIISDADKSQEVMLIHRRDQRDDIAALNGYENVSLRLM